MLPDETWEKFQTKWDSVLLNMDGQSMKPTDLELFHRLQEIIPLDVIQKIMTNQKPKDYTELMRELEEYYTVIGGLAEGAAMGTDGGGAGGGAGGVTQVHDAVFGEGTDAAVAGCRRGGAAT